MLLPEHSEFDAEAGCLRWPDALKFPRYPVFVPSKGRAHYPLTIRFLQQDEVPFRVVVVPEEVDEYAKILSDDQMLVLPRGDLKLVGTRNWIRDVAEQEGFARHWQLDDNIRRVYRTWVNGLRIPCDSGPALRAIEDFSDRYENVGLSGMNYRWFICPGHPAYWLNTHVYSCTLVNHANPYRWRLVYNDDTDICLQTLGSDYWCTINTNVFAQEKLTTMTVSGGNTDELYKSDGQWGRWYMARSLEQMWPDVVKVNRRYGRTQHVVQWQKFKHALIPKEDIEYDEIDEYTLRLVELKELQSEKSREALREYKERETVGRSG